MVALDGVIEADYGDWTGGKIADLAKTDEWKVVQVAPSRARFPAASRSARCRRVVAALDAVVAAHPHETVVVVSHADPIKSAIAHYAGMHLDLFQRVHVSPASVTVLEFHAHGVLLVKCNDTGSLDELLPAPPAGHRARAVMADIIEFDPVDTLSAGVPSACPASARSSSRPARARPC